MLDSPAAAKSLRQILVPVADDLAAMDQVIRRHLASDVALVNQVSDYIVGSGGKRLRPASLMLVCRALGYRGETHHVLAAVIEFIHTATLLHDDVVDESSLRRGRSTANITFGNAASVLVGDFLYSRAFQLMVAAGVPKVLNIMADATNRIAEGEVLQLMNVHDPSIDETRYREVVDRKTATLFSAATRLGAVVAGANEPAEKRCASLGSHLGTAFQMIDDLLDFEGDVEQIGKKIGDDLREGKCTLPLIFALSSVSGAERDEIASAIELGDGDFGRIAEIVRRSNAIEQVRDATRAELHAATEAAMALPRSVYRDSLLDLCAFTLQRDH